MCSQPLCRIKHASMPCHGLWRLLKYQIPSSAHATSWRQHMRQSSWHPAPEREWRAVCAVGAGATCGSVCRRCCCSRGMRKPRAAWGVRRSRTRTTHCSHAWRYVVRRCDYCSVTCTFVGCIGQRGRSTGAPAMQVVIAAMVGPGLCMLNGVM